MAHRFGSPMASRPENYHYLPQSTDTHYQSNGYYGDKPDSSEQYRLVEDDNALASISSHHDYPRDQPFIYDNYRRDQTKHDKSYPENNREAVMKALRSLQDKMKQLELERAEAEDNLKALASETSHYRDMLHRQPDITDVDQNVSGLGGENRGIHVYGLHGLDGNSKLESAEQRCKLLEQQLDCMRNMVQNAEHDRTNAVRQSAILRQQREEVEQDDIRNQLSKISDLERDHLKLTATQTVAENKIRDLEEKLKEERHYRKMMQTKTAEFETAAQARRILRDASDGTNDRKPTKTKKKKKVTSTIATRPASAKVKKVKVTSTRKPGMEPPDHYRLNLGEIPFISGKSTTPSHSLAANFQEVLSLMKVHNPKLCRSPRSHTHTTGLQYFKDRPTSHRSNSSDVTDLLLQLQDEFGEMSIEHQELSEQIQTATDIHLQEDLERELDALVARMEAKGDQISRLRRHHELLASRSRAAKKSTLPATTSVEIPCRDTDYQGNGQVEVTTTIRTKGGSKPSSPSNKHASLSLYKGLKKIQNTLRKDDLSWD